MFRNSEILDVSFSLPSPFTLGDVEKWETARVGAISAGAVTVLSIQWMAARAVIIEWECGALTLDAEPETISNEQLQIIAWVGREVEKFILDLTSIPKN